jgi:predicted phage terminase large subunit-like protein
MGTADPPSATSPVTSPSAIDGRLAFPNLGGLPLWLVPYPLTEEQIGDITRLWELERAGGTLVAYAEIVLGLQPALHHRLICDALDEAFSAMSEYDDILICTPPGAAKSTYVSHAAAAYFMGRFPAKSVIFTTHTSELSERWSRQVRNSIATVEHQRVFPDCQLSKDSTAVGRWATTQGGEFLAVGVGTAILGFRADTIFIDDPIKGFEEAQSENQLSKIHSWFETDLITRLKPGGKIVQVCQRLSPNDLAGYMLRRAKERGTRRLKVLTFRMEAEEGDCDGTGRAPGERLWPEWFTSLQVEDARADEYIWRTLFQQRPPSDSGDWVGAENLTVVDIIPATLTRYLLTDIALSINKGDYSVHIAAGVDDVGTIYVEDAWRGRTAPEETARRHLDMIEVHHPIECLIDDDNASKVYVQLLHSLSRQRSPIVSVPWHPMPLRGQDKETRAAPLRGLLRTGRVRFKKGPYTSWLFPQLLGFPNLLGDGVDDGVDALSLIGRRLIKLGRPPTPAPVLPMIPAAREIKLDELWETLSRPAFFKRD